MWIQSRDTDCAANPCADRNARAESITHCRAASAAGGDRTVDRERCAAHPGR